MRDEDFVTKTRIVVVTFDPIDHVTAIARAGPANAVLVNVRKPGNHRNAVANVRKNFAAPIAGNLI